MHSNFGFKSLQLAKKKISIQLFFFAAGRFERQLFVRQGHHFEILIGLPFEVLSYFSRVEMMEGIRRNEGMIQQ